MAKATGCPAGATRHRGRVCGTPDSSFCAGGVIRTCAGLDKQKVAEVLVEIGTLLELKGENPFKARAEPIIAEELQRQGWGEAQLRQRRKSDPVKLALAGRLRRGTILTVGWIAKRLEMGTRQSVATRLPEQSKTHERGHKPE
jgi:hypothetical protein